MRKEFNSSEYHFVVMAQDNKGISTIESVEEVIFKGGVCMSGVLHGMINAAAGASTGNKFQEIVGYAELGWGLVGGGVLTKGIVDLAKNLPRE
jgi:hypothetical protein